MRTWSLVAVVVALVGAAAWWWPTDRRRIIAASRELAEAVAVPPAEPEVARVVRAARLLRLLAPEFRLIDAEGRAVVDGRDAAVGVATKLQPPRGLLVEVGPLEELVIDAGRTARARTVITLREPRADGPGDSTESRAVRLAWLKEDAWTLSELSLEGEQ